MEKTFTKLEKESVKIGMLKKIAILGKWFSPESELEKILYKTYQSFDSNIYRIRRWYLDKRCTLCL